MRAQVQAESALAASSAADDHLIDIPLIYRVAPPSDCKILGR